jgi:hypothetical protein
MKTGCDNSTLHEGISEIMKQAVLKMVLYMALLGNVSAQDYTYTISGVFTDVLLGTPGPSITVGTPFSATITYRLPGNPVLFDGGIGWYEFNAEKATGSVLLGSEQFSIRGGNLIIWHENPAYSTVSLEGFGGGLIFRSVLSTADRESLDTAHIPDALTLSQFDSRREFQVFDGAGVSIIGRIETLAVVPEPDVISIGAGGAVLLLLARVLHRRRLRFAEVGRRS